MTEWRKLDWLPDYEVSEDGQVRRATGGLPGASIGLILSPGVRPTGYRAICVRAGSAPRKNFYIHRLVCEAWHGKPPFPRAQVGHIDGNPANNHHSNLRWVTAAENGLDRIKHGRVPSGENARMSRLTWEAVRAIRAEYTGAAGELRLFARRFGVARATIHRVVHYQCWREVA